MNEFIKTMVNIMIANGVTIEFSYDSVLNGLNVMVTKRGGGRCRFMMSEESVTADRDLFLYIESPEQMVITNLETAVRAIIKQEEKDGGREKM